MALVAEAKRKADKVVASLFVNPRQFSPSEDLARYPRREASDARMLEAEGCALLWVPPAEVMYPDGFASTISVAGVSEGLDGGVRPGHFDGVATVVAKLFNQVRPDFALFGEKDFQQLHVVRRMVADLDFPVEVVGVPTQRDDDGLALSSRNTYLDPASRAAARALPRALGEAAETIETGGSVATALDTAIRRMMEAGFDSVDYVELRDAITLDPVTTLDAPARLLAAARIAGTRLIDNLQVVPRPAG